jgi:hypothetical protein
MMETYDGSEDDSDYEEYSKNSVPGPGSYNIDTGLLNKKKTHSLFISKAERFHSIKQASY